MSSHREGQQFHSADALHAWFAHHHAMAPELVIRLFKKASEQATVSREESVMAALAWGWIDGIHARAGKDSCSGRFGGLNAQNSTDFGGRF
jgi:uncharacterized protein YdeI (YjbR/CyaY-like superfamily)